LSLQKNDKAEICELVGQAFHRLGALDDALSSFSQAQNLHPAPAAMKRIKEELRAVRQALAEQRGDRDRQPSIKNDVSQPSVVRPRIASIKAKSGIAEFQGGHR
jgi:hypothetical protein